LLFDFLIETAAVRQFHDQVELAVNFVERVNVNDIRVVQRGAGAASR